MNKTRRYHSPLRAARAEATRTAILDAAADWMQRKPHEALTLEAVARVAGIERRTVFRHFATKEVLLAACWARINEKVAPQTLPTSLPELLAAPPATFARFDEEEGVIRASLHSGAGREMRLARADERRTAFRDALREVTRHAPPAQRRKLECVTHALYSAAAWEAMRDYAGATGAEAGAAVAWALTILTDAVRTGGAKKE
jgi:AcrR family transcriptional regulator